MHQLSAFKWKQIKPNRWANPTDTWLQLKYVKMESSTLTFIWSGLTC
jgi:hypothetical protein